MSSEKDNCSLSSKTSLGVGTELGQSGNGNQLSSSQFPWFAPFLCFGLQSYELNVRAQCYYVQKPLVELHGKVALEVNDQ